jgi:AbrB family looped-hinge helix DNA binding protein
MQETTTRLTSKGQVTIPVHVRRALGLKPRDRVAFSLEDGVATVRKAESVVDRLAGSVKWTGGPIDFKGLRAEFEDEMGRDVQREMGLEPPDPSDE